MTKPGVPIGVLCATALLSSLAAGQMGSSPNQPMQPNQPVTGSAAGGMAGAMTATSGTGDPIGQGMKDKLFLHHVAEEGYAEIQLGLLAVRKSSDEGVKRFAQKMITDHAMLNDSMRPLADSMGVKQPTHMGKKAQAEYDKLTALTGDDFDKEYLAYMVKDHHMDLREFEDEDETAVDSTLKSTVDKGLQTVQKHTRIVDQLAQSKGLPVPGR